MLQRPGLQRLRQSRQQRHHFGLQIQADLLMLGHLLLPARKLARDCRASSTRAHRPRRGRRADGSLSCAEVRGAVEAPTKGEPGRVVPNPYRPLPSAFACDRFDPGSLLRPGIRKRRRTGNAATRGRFLTMLRPSRTVRARTLRLAVGRLPIAPDGRTNAFVRFLEGEAAALSGDAPRSNLRSRFQGGQEGFCRFAR